MIAVIGDQETAAGFRLAGVSEVYEPKVGLEGDTVRLLDKLTRDEIAVIIINESFTTETSVQEKIKAINEKKQGVIPVIVTIPDKKGPSETKVDEIGDLIKRAVGVAVE